MKNLRDRIDEISRMVIDKHFDIQRIKIVMNNDIRTEDLMKLGKEMLFVDPEAEKLEALTKEMEKSCIE